MKILFVANTFSIHTARWIAQLSQQGWDIHIFPSRDLEVNPKLSNVTIHDFPFKPLDADQSIHFEGPEHRNNLYNWILSRKRVQHIVSARPEIADITSFAQLDNYAKIMGARIAEIIQRIKPDIIHSLMFQYDSYPTLEAKRLLPKNFPVWIVSNWGADIHYFGQFSDHATRITEVLKSCDYYACECNRDVELARAYGFQGKFLPVMPNTGGFDVEWIQQFRQEGKVSSRKTVSLKGYKDWVYRGLVGLEALSLCKECIFDRGYTVAIYLGGTVMKACAETYGLPFEMIPYGPHEQMLRLHGRSRISIGLSLSDAISTSFLEAIAMGSFPIQSDTGCANEWIIDGSTGFIVPPEDVSFIAQAIQKALTDDNLVDSAAEINWNTVAERLNSNTLSPQAIQIYRNIYSETKVNN